MCKGQGEEGLGKSPEKPKLKGAEDEESPTRKGGVAKEGKENLGECGGIHSVSLGNGSL